MANKRILTKEWLESQKITFVGYDVYHYTPFKGNTKLKPVLNTYPHKYGKDIQYYIIGWYSRDDHKQYAFPYHRALYAWYHGEVPVGYDIDHKDGDTLNNELTNLQVLSRKDNIAKRNGAKNQYEAMSKKAQEDFYDDCERVAK